LDRHGVAAEETAATRTLPKTTSTRVLSAQAAVTQVTHAAAATAELTAVRVQRGLAPVTAGLRRHGVPPAVVYAAAGLVALVLIIVIASPGGSGSRSFATKSPPAPAAGSAPLSQQLSALDRIIDQAQTRH
jgi:hypothetical protein